MLPLVGGARVGSQSSPDALLGPQCSGQPGPLAEGGERLNSCEVGRERPEGRCVGFYLWLCLHFLFMNGGTVRTPIWWWWKRSSGHLAWGQSHRRQNLSHASPFPVSENDWTLGVSAPKAGRTPLGVVQPDTLPAPDDTLMLGAPLLLLEWAVS